MEKRFKAWDGFNKIMFDDGLTIKDLFKVVGMCYGTKEYGKYDSMISEEMEYLQFTGLKDKNGKEIYEGDIISFYYDDFEKRYTGQVKFINGGFNYYDNDEGRDPSEYDNDTLQGVEQNGEVIGNIYENPELLLIKSEVE